MVKFWRCALPAAMALALLQGPANAAHKGWYVIMGSFHHTAGEDAQEQVRRIASACGLDARWDDALFFENMNPDVVFVYLGPYHRKSQANAIRKEARECVSDTYIKWGRPK